MVRQIPRGDKDPAKDKRKEVDQKLARLKVLKPRMDGVIATYHLIVEAAEKDPQGEWDFGPNRMKHLRDLKVTVDSAAMQSDFWKDWSTSSNFSSQAKKKHTLDEITKFLKGSGAIEGAVENLEKQIERLRNMRQADKA